MQILTGRLTADAKVTTAKNTKEVVNFSIAMNHKYKSGDQLKEEKTFVECSYWIGTAIAPYLKKGTIVSVCGNLSVSAYINKKDEPVGKLNFHVNAIELLGKSQPATNSPDEVDEVVVATIPGENDLPF